MKYLFYLFIVLFFSCRKLSVVEKIITSNNYLVKYSYNHSHYDHLATYPGTNNPVLITEHFDTIIELEITTSNILNEKIEIYGLMKFEKSEQFDNNINNPILTNNNQLVIPDYYILDTLNGFLKDDSIYYHFSVKDHYIYNYTMMGHKIE